MRSMFLMLPAAVLSLSAAHAGAQTQAAPMTEPEPTSRVQVTAPPQPFQFYFYEAEFISGAYAMSNGWRMKVDPSERGIVAQIGKRSPMQLMAVSRDRYVSRDGMVSMEFNRGARGDEMLMSYVPDVRMAQVVEVTARLAQR